MRRNVGLIAITSACLCWADADFGIKTKHSATINVSRPPEAMLRGKNITIKGRDGVAAFKDRQALELAVERALSSEFTPTKDGRDLVLTLAVSAFEPVTVKTPVVTENRLVVVGKKMQKSLITGKMVAVDDYQMRAVPVQYWEARGALSLQITVHDSKGTLLDSFQPQSQYQHRVETAENRKPSKLKQPLPTPSELQAGLIEKVAADLKSRYTKTTVPVEVRLTVDDPLRPGNVLAMSGQWKEALVAWTSASQRKNPGDRAYNMAVGYEALAYQAYEASRNPEDAAEAFQQAVKLYEEALRSDPGEKFFREAMTRCAGMKDNFGRAKDQYASQQRQAEVELIKAEEKQRNEQTSRQEGDDRKQYLESTRADNQEEADFRAIVRGRIRSLGKEPDAAAQLKLVQLGKSAYKLEDLPAQRVVYQESGRLTRVKTNLELYKQTFSDFVADKILDSTDRGSLARLAKRLDLTDDDVKPIEAQFQFKDLTAPGPVSTTQQQEPRNTPPKNTPEPKPTVPVKPQTRPPAPNPTKPVTTTPPTPGMKK